MPLAEDRTEQYIRFHLSDFFRVDVLEILSHLPCLTAADQDSLRAYIDRHGNRDSVWKLFDHLRRRNGWVTCLITALKECELMDLADVIASVYASSQARFQSHPGAITAPVPPSAPARNQQVTLPTPPQPSVGVPGPHLPASRSPATQPAPSLPDSTYNGYPELKEEEAGGHTAPIQDTRPPDSKSEVPGATLNPAHSGATSRSPQSSLGYSSFSAPASTVTGKHRKASGGSGDRSPASASLPPSSRGPVSPSVSFVPRSKKADPTSGPTASVQSNENHPAAAPAIHSTGLPTSKLQEPQKVPPLASKFPSPPHQVSRGPASSGQAPPPHVEDEMMSKPGVLLSYYDQPYSGCSKDLIISGDSGSGGPLLISASSRNLPEENDYSSVTSVPSPGKPAASGAPKQLGGSKSSSLETFELCVDEKPSEVLLGGSPDLGQTPGTTAQPGVGPNGDGSWGVWLGSAVAVALFSVALAIFYKRIQK